MTCSPHKYQLYRTLSLRPVYFKCVLETQPNLWVSVYDSRIPMPPAGNSAGSVVRIGRRAIPDAISVTTFRGSAQLVAVEEGLSCFLVSFRPRSFVGSIPIVASFFLATSGTNHVALLLFSPPLIELIHGKLDVLGICADFLFARAATIEQRVCCFWSYVVVVCRDILVSKRHWRKKPPTASSSSSRNHCIGGGCGCSCGRSGEG